MSTTINVTVDDGGLPAKNRQQAAANRQAFVQGRASQQAAQQGVDQRAADRRAAGLDPATGRPLSSAGASAGASSRLPRIQQELAANRGDEYFELVPSGPIFNVNEVTLRHQGLISKAYNQNIPPRVQYDASGGPNAGPVYAVYPSPRGNYQTIASIGEQSQASGFKYGTRDFTLQAYFKLADSFVYLQDSVDITLQVGNAGWAYMTFSLNSSFGLPRKRIKMQVRNKAGASVDEIIDHYVELSDTTFPSLTPGSWHHAAITKKGSIVRGFFDGAECGQIPVMWTTLEYDITTSGFFDLRFGTSQVLTTIADPVYVYGVRFDIKCLYTSNFIPPKL